MKRHYSLKYCFLNCDEKRSKEKKIPHTRKLPPILNKQYYNNLKPHEHNIREEGLRPSNQKKGELSSKIFFKFKICREGMVVAILWPPPFQIMFIDLTRSRSLVKSRFYLKKNCLKQSSCEILLRFLLSIDVYKYEL